MRRRNRSATFSTLFLLCLIGNREEVHKMKENKFQANLKKELKKMFPGCIVTKMDSGDIQGIPDLLILFGKKWASLECKQNANAKKQPNQEYYVGLMNEMSFSRFICPENKEEVLDELYKAFKS